MSKELRELVAKWADEYQSLFGTITAEQARITCRRHAKELETALAEKPAERPAEEQKGICEYCHKPVVVRMSARFSEAWHSKGDKVWHEVCSYQQEIERLKHLFDFRAERPQLSAEQVREFATEYLAFAKYAFGDSRNAWPMSVYHLAEMADALLTGVAEKVPPDQQEWLEQNGVCEPAPAAPPVLQAPVAQRRTEYVDPLANRLAIYAKQLAEGMRQRVKRNPDVADYLPEFTRLIENFGNEVERKAERAAFEKAAQRAEDFGMSIHQGKKCLTGQGIAEAIRALADSPVSGEAKEKP